MDLGFPGGTSGKKPTCQCRGHKRLGPDPWEAPLEESMGTHSSVRAWRIPMDRGAWRATVHGVTKVGHSLASKQSPPILKTEIYSLEQKSQQTHSSILAWRIPQAEEPGRLQSIGSQRVGHN